MIEIRIFSFIGILLLMIPPSSQWSTRKLAHHPISADKARFQSKFFSSSGLFGTAIDNNGNESPAVGSTVSHASILKSYEYDRWKLTYRTISDSDGTSAIEDQKNVLLIHPVGVGLASWFWDPLLACIGERNSSNNGSKAPAMRAFAPNLIGCGISEGSDAWDPDQRDLFVPMGWVKGFEAFWNHIDDQDFDNSGVVASPPKKWTVVAQGGLAAIGILLAARNPERIDKLVLTSPPTWEDITTAVPQDELERNYNFLRSPILGKLAFSLLEQRSLIEFFSNQFLFSERCDDTWLDKTEEELCEAARPPVQVFNAGLLLNRGLKTELTEDIQHKIPELLVVQGEGDKRPREEYTQNLQNCRLVTLPGTNVVPWEYPETLVDLL